MKKEISLEWASKFTSIINPEDIKSSGGNNEPTGSLPKGTKFQLVDYGQLIGINGGNPYEGFLIELENGRQTGISVRVFLGNYFVASVKDDKVVTTLKTLDTPYRVSGLNALDFLKANEDTIFICGNPVKYDALQYGSEDIIKPKTIMTYSKSL